MTLAGERTNAVTLWYVTGQVFVVDGGQSIRGLVPVENSVQAGNA